MSLPRDVPSAKRQRPFAALERRLWRALGQALYALGYGSLMFWMFNGFSFA